MKSIYCGFVVALFAAQPALAESCQERFVRLLKATQDATVPTKKEVVTEMKGGPTMTTENFWISQAHNMTAMRQPPRPWTLVSNGAMSTSMDKGESWNKLRDLDPAATKSHIDALADTVENAVCGEAELDGATVDTVEADYTMGEGDNLTKIHDKYWVSREDEFIPMSETTMKMPSFESFVTQRIEKAPDLKLPTPE